MSNIDEYFESLMITNEDIPGVEEAVEGIIGDKIFSGLMKLSIKHGHPDNLSGEKLNKWNFDKRILLNSLKSKEVYTCKEVNEFINSIFPLYDKITSEMIKVNGIYIKYQDDPENTNGYEEKKKIVSELNIINKKAKSICDKAKNSDFSINGISYLYKIESLSDNIFNKFYNGTKKYDKYENQNVIDMYKLHDKNLEHLIQLSYGSLFKFSKEKRKFNGIFIEKIIRNNKI